MVARLALAPCTARLTRAIGRFSLLQLSSWRWLWSCSPFGCPRLATEQAAHGAPVALGHNAGAAEPPLLARGLLGEQVVQLGVAAQQLAVLGHGEAAGGASVGLHLRHGLVSLVLVIGGWRVLLWLLTPAPAVAVPTGCPARRVVPQPRAGCPSGCARRGRGGAALGLRRALAWREHRDHVAAVLPSRTVDLGDVHDVGGQSFEQAPAELGVRHLSAAEHDRHLDLVALLEEPLDVALLRLVVVVVDLGPHLHFLQGHQALLAPGLLGLDGLLVLVLRVVHQLGDRRPRQGRDLDQIEIGATCDPQSGLRVHDPELLAVRTDHPELRRPDTVVDSRLNADATSLLYRSADPGAVRAPARLAPAIGGRNTKRRPEGRPTPAIGWRSQ